MLKFKLKVGSRAQVMHGTAKMTGGGLTKRQLKYNKNGKIVSKKASKTAKKINRLVKGGYVTRKGVFGVIRKGGAASAAAAAAPAALGRLELSPNLQSLVNSGHITHNQARQMMPEEHARIKATKSWNMEYYSNLIKSINNRSIFGALSSNHKSFEKLDTPEVRKFLYEYISKLRDFDASGNHKSLKKEYTNKIINIEPNKYKLLEVRVILKRLDQKMRDCRIKYLNNLYEHAKYTAYQVERNQRREARRIASMKKNKDLLNRAKRLGNI